MGLQEALSGTYYDLVKTGRVFYGTTGASGVDIPIFSNTTQQAVLYNPKNSSRDLVILKVYIGHVSDTMAVGHFCYAVSTNLQQTAATGTAGTITNALGGDGGSASSANFFTAATVVALSYLSPMGISSVAQADASTNAPYTMIDDVRGALIVQPGGHLAVASTDASYVTASVGIVWYEQPK